jgi:glyoxylase-like metal-dependent hydrolase (beta-lactamase superfamily II)
MVGMTTVATDRYAVGAATLVRVPYAEVLVDAEVVGLSADWVAEQRWAAPTWAEGAQVRVAAAVWIIESGTRRIVVDPAQAADDILRGADAVAHQEAMADVLARAGYPRESVDTVIATHIDGIGMIAWRNGDAWQPFFPSAEVILSQHELAAIAANEDYRPQGGDALLELDARGVVSAVGEEHTVTPDVTVRWTGAHSPGHQVVDIGSGDERATMLGHLALNPLHLGVDAGPHRDPIGAAAALCTLADGRLLIGPLWPAPGAVRWSGARVDTVRSGFVTSADAEGHGTAGKGVSSS